MPLSPSEAISAFGEFDPTSQGLGRVAFVVALCAAGVLERAQFRLRFLEKRTWWASNGRDVLNALAFGALWGACVLIGYPGPLCIVISACVLVLVNALQSGLGLRRGATRISVLLALGLGLPVAIAPRAVDGVVRTALTTLF